LTDICDLEGYYASARDTIHGMIPSTTVGFNVDDLDIMHTTVPEAGVASYRFGINGINAEHFYPK